MRIIGGILKGKQIAPPKNLDIRPTTDFAKEGLFNLLNNRVDFVGLTVLDLFSGTGNISLEFASREAKKVTSVDIHTPCLNFLKDTAKSLKLKVIYTERAEVIKYLSKSNTSYDLIFADPPYELPTLLDIHELVFKNNYLEPNGWLIIEHGSKTDFSKKTYFVDTRKYGNVHFSFFKNEVNE